MEEELALMDSLDQEPSEDHLSLDDLSSLKQHKNAARLQSMHQAYRKMEKKKRFYHIEVEGLMRRQQACLDNLTSDNSALQEIVDTYEIKDYRKQMDKLMDESKKYTGLIEVETKRVNYLDAKIRDSNSKELDSKRRMGGYMAGWKKHITTQIHIQQNENKLQKAIEDTNIVKGDMKVLKSKISQLKREHDFYTNVYQKLNTELNEWEEDIQQCITDMNAMYADRSEYQDAISDLMEMVDYKNIYSQWLSTEGWVTQESYSMKDLESSQLAYYETEDIKDNTKEPESEALPKHTNMNRTRKSRISNLRNISRTHYAKRSKASSNYRPWVEIKAFGNVQELLNADNIANVLPTIIDRQCKNVELYKHIQELVKEMDALDLARQDNIFDKPVPLENGDIKASVGSRKCETNHLVTSILDSVRHLEIDEEAYLPVVIDLRKQILVTFKEAGCYIKDEEQGMRSNGDNQGATELTVGNLFSSLEDFINRVSGTSS